MSSNRPKVTATFVPGPFFMDDSGVFSCARCGKKAPHLVYKYRAIQDDDGRYVSTYREIGPWCEACVKEADRE